MEAYYDDTPAPLSSQYERPDTAMLQARRSLL